MGVQAGAGHLQETSRNFFARDLSSIVYSRPGGDADVYLLSQTP